MINFLKELASKIMVVFFVIVIIAVIVNGMLAWGWIGSRIVSAIVGERDYQQDYQISSLKKQIENLETRNSYVKVHPPILQEDRENLNNKSPKMIDVTTGERMAWVDKDGKTHCKKGFFYGIDCRD